METIEYLDSVIFKNTDLEVSKCGKKLLFVVFKQRLANRINDALGQYYPVTIKQGEEPIFKITTDEAMLMLNSCFKPSLSRVLHKLLSKA